MHINESRYRHYKKLAETPGVVVMMSEYMQELVEFLSALERRLPEATFGTLMCAAALGNMVYPRYHEVRE